jgi:hypothetical protein
MKSLVQPVVYLLLVACGGAAGPGWFNVVGAGAVTRSFSKP